MTSQVVDDLRAVQLMAEFEEFKARSASALEQAWAEVERLEHENHRKDQNVEHLEDQLQDLHATLESVTQQLQETEKRLAETETKLEDMINENENNNKNQNSIPSISENSTTPQHAEANNGSTSSALVRFNLFSSPSIKRDDDASCVTAPPLTPKSSHFPDLDESESMSAVTMPPLYRFSSTGTKLPVPVEKTKNINRGSSWGSLFGHQSYNHEADLLRQLEILQDEKMHQADQFELKLKQREDAITTLERTVVLTSDTVKMLRDELSQLQREKTSDKRRKPEFEEEEKKRDEPSYERKTRTRQRRRSSIGW